MPHERVMTALMPHMGETSRGSVEQARILRGLDERLDLSALNAFEQWELQPAARDGEPVAVEAVVRIPFRSR